MTCDNGRRSARGGAPGMGAGEIGGTMMGLQQLATALVCVSLLGLLPACQATVPPEFEECRPESYAALERLGIEASRVRGFTSTPQRVFLRRGPGDGDDRIVGYSNWLRLEGCERETVLRFDRFCRLRQVYDRSDCLMDSRPAAVPGRSG